MELNQRKLTILHAIIDDYILTGVPIGSRTIAKRSGFNLSSATIRNEMADLEEEGYLEQPHTSAGRMPSDKAYRLYVNMLMGASQLEAQEIRHIKNYFNVKMAEMEQVIDLTAKVLSETTNLTSVVLAPQYSGIELRRIQVVALDETRALVVFVMNTGMVKEFLIPIPRDLSSEYLEMISNVLTERVANRTLNEAVVALRSITETDFPVHKELVSTLVEAVSHSGHADKQKKVVLGGTQNIFNYPEYQDVEKVKGFLKLLEARDSLYDMLTQATDMEFAIRIGRENEIDQLKDMSVVTATYKVGQKTIGSFGVIGPTRMDYQRVMSVLSCVGTIMNDMLGTVLGTPSERDQE